MQPVTLDAPSEAKTETLGRALAGCLPRGAVVGLTGPLGAGKTRLVQAVAVAAGVDRPDVMSPTFVLVHEYHDPRSIYHVDLYRVADEDELLNLGLEEYFEGDGWTFVEWADRFEQHLPRERLMIDLAVSGEQSRRITLQPHGTAYAEILDCVLKRLNAEGQPQSGTCPAQPQR